MTVCDGAVAGYHNCMLCARTYLSNNNLGSNDKTRIKMLIQSADCFHLLSNPSSSVVPSKWQSGYLQHSSNAVSIDLRNPLNSSTRRVS